MKQVNATRAAIAQEVMRGTRNLHATVHATQAWERVMQMAQDPKQLRRVGAYLRQVEREGYTDESKVIAAYHRAAEELLERTRARMH